MGRVLIIVLSGFLLSGCELQRAADANRAQKDLIGISKSELLNCAGVPVRSITNDGLEYMAYSTTGNSVISGMGVGDDNSSFFSGILNNRNCEATFILDDDVVTKINYNGRTGGLLTKGMACYPIIENCLN